MQLKNIKVNYIKEDLKAAVDAASASDLVIVFSGYKVKEEHENEDRKSLSLPDGQDQMISAVAKANSHTVVIVNSGGPVLMPWVHQVSGIFQAWYLGEEGGEAIANILLGVANPSAKLTSTFMQRWEDSSAFGYYPGQNHIVNYREDIFVGYRHFDQKNIEPLFPFGHGLSYTQFEYSHLQIKKISGDFKNPEVEVSFDLKNVGERDGAEVVQLYVGEKDPTVARPIKELKAFTKVKLSSGQSKRVNLKLVQNAFHFYDVGTHDWKINPGQFEISIGSSSRDLRLKGLLF